jgi:hypothetical protein
MVNLEEPSLETTSGGLTPLRQFKGTLADYRFEDRETTDDDGKTRTYRVVMFDFVDLEVIKSTEPYPFPIASIQIGYSQTTETKYGRFAQSVKALLPDAVDLKPLKGKRQEWAVLKGATRARDEQGKWGEAEVDLWKVISIEGVEKVDIAEHVIDLADGKSEAAFNEAAFTDDVVRAHPEIVSLITERKLLSTYIDAGLLSRDAEGVLHRVKAKVEAK